MPDPAANGHPSGHPAQPPALVGPAGDERGHLLNGARISTGDNRNRGPRRERSGRS
jgi:hypothetical protein